MKIKTQKIDAEVEEEYLNSWLNQLRFKKSYTHKRQVILRKHNFKSQNVFRAKLKTYERNIINLN